MRAVALDGRGAIELVARAGLRSRRLSPLRVEYDPEQVLRAATRCLAAALARLGGAGAVRAAGLATQRSTFLVWRRTDGRPLTPAFGWQSRDAGAPPPAAAARRVARLSGLRWSPHYAAPRAALLLRRRPRLRDLLEAGRACLGTLDSFLIFRWSRGDIFRTDPTHAQRTLLYSPARGDWDPRLLRAFSIPRPGLPDIGSSTGLELPLPGLAARLAASCGDQQAALHAVGARSPRACMINYGTGAFVLSPCGPRARRPPGLLVAEALGASGERGRALEAPLPTAAAAFHLLHPAPRAVAARAGAPAKGSWPGRSASLRGWDPAPLLVAATDGLGAPFWLEQVPSLLLFVRPPDRARAERAAEGSLAASVQAALEALRPAPVRLIATGGLAARDSLVRRQADLAGRPIERAPGMEWTGLGAALAAAGQERPRRLRLPLQQFTPDPRRRGEALREYRLWRRAVRFLKSLAAS